jgi:hypothetical protein
MGGLVRDVGSKHKQLWNGRIAFSWLVILIILSSAIISAERLRTMFSHEIQSGSTQVGRYFHSGRWLADVRTFRAACQFVMEGDAAAPGQGSAPGIQLATPQSEHSPGWTRMGEAGQPPQKDS